MTGALQSMAINWSEGRRDGGGPLCKPKIRGISCTELSLKDSNEQVESLRVKLKRPSCCVKSKKFGRK